MKKTVYILAFAFFTVFLFSCGSGKKDNTTVDTDIVNIPDANSDPGTMPVMTFESETYDFKEITEGEKVSHIYKFKNTGGSDLVISSAKGSCGCTVPEYPTKPIKPNETGEIKVTFDSQGKLGFSKKEVVIVTNAQPNTKIITFQVHVMSPADK